LGVQAAHLIPGQSLGLTAGHPIHLLDLLRDVGDSTALFEAVQDNLTHGAKCFIRDALDLADVLIYPAAEGFFVEVAVVVVIHQVDAEGILTDPLPLPE